MVYMKPCPDINVVMDSSPFPPYCNVEQGTINLPKNKFCTTGSTLWSGAMGEMLKGHPCTMLRWQMHRMNYVANCLPATDHFGQRNVHHM